MKIEIDLQDILGDEYGDMESLAQSIERQVIDNITNTLSSTLSKKIISNIGDSVTEMIDGEVKNAAALVGKELTDGLIDYEYTPIDGYGRRSEKTTMRNEFIKSLTSQMIYKSARYESDKSSFTKSVDVILAQELKKFQEEYNSILDETFTKEAFEYAVFKMKEKLKLGEKK